MSQDQRAGDNSTNYQANAITIVNGVTLEDVHVTVKALFDSNFPKLLKDAEIVIQRRFREMEQRMAQLVVERLTREQWRSFADPDVQYKTYETFREGVRIRDTQLRELLMQLLVKRVASDDIELDRIVLNDALTVAPRLTSTHLSVLALISLFEGLRDFRLRDLASLVAFADRLILPMVISSPSQEILQHLESLGCVRNLHPRATSPPDMFDPNAGRRSGYYALCQAFGGALQSPFEFEECQSGIAPAVVDGLILQSGDVANRYIFDFQSTRHLIAKAMAQEGPNEDVRIRQLLRFHQNNRIHEREFSDSVWRFKGLRRFISFWPDCRLADFELFPVGRVLGDLHLEIRDPELMKGTMIFDPST